MATRLGSVATRLGLALGRLVAPADLRSDRRRAVNTAPETAISPLVVLRFILLNSVHDLGLFAAAGTNNGTRGGGRCYEEHFKWRETSSTLSLHS